MKEKVSQGNVFEKVKEDHNDVEKSLSASVSISLKAFG